MGPNDKKTNTNDVLVDEEEQDIVNEEAYLDSLIAIFTDENLVDLDDDEDLPIENRYWDE